MDLLINHLTRMRPGTICAAGIDIRTYKHVRIVSRVSMPTDFLSRNGGPLSVGRIVRARPRWWQFGKIPPHIDDVRFKFRKLKRRDLKPAIEFWKCLDHVSEENLFEMFEDLTPHGDSTFYVRPGRGTSSLGCLKIRERVKITARTFSGEQPRVRIRFTHRDRILDLPVTDIRLFSGENFELNEDAVGRLRHALRDSEEVILSVGLTRGFAGPLRRPVHWLQVNNVHLRTRWDE